MRDKPAWFLLVASLLAASACGEAPVQPPPTTSASAKPSPAALLTDAEIQRLFLEGAQVWKFASESGTRLASVTLRLVEDGKPTVSSTSHLVSDQGAVTVIVAVQEIGKVHRRKLSVQRSGTGASLSTTEGWFSRPLRNYAVTTQTAVGILRPGTIPLIAGSPEAADGSIFDAATAPSRLELVVE